MKDPLKIAILGCRGIPNHYGGFEELAQHLAEGLTALDWEVTVYNSSRHPYQEKKWKQVNIVHCPDPEHRIGTAGQFMYDLHCIRHAGRQDYDILLFLGYTSSSVWGRWFPKKPVIVSNMDGWEWKRSKYSAPVRKFLKYAEGLAVRYSHYLVADSPVIASYLNEKYQTKSCHIPYGAETGTRYDTLLLKTFNIEAGNYFMLMARMEPENNIEMILDGFQQSSSKKRFLVVGNTGNGFGRRMKRRFGRDSRILFAGAQYEPKTTHLLRSACSLYFHGHSVGGTNPSLLQAMADGAVIAAHDNPFNRAVTEGDAWYFRSPRDIKQLVEDEEITEKSTAMIAKNLDRITTNFNWPKVIAQYADFLTACHQRRHK